MLNLSVAQRIGCTRPERSDRVMKQKMSRSVLFSGKLTKDGAKILRCVMLLGAHKASEMREHYCPGASLLEETMLPR